MAVFWLPVECEREVVAAFYLGVECDASAHMRVQLVAGEMRSIRFARRNRYRQLAQDVKLWPRKERIDNVLRLEILRRSDEPYRYVKYDAYR